MNKEPLTDAELDRLDAFLAGIGDTAMTLEEMDGYFAALISGPELVTPMEALAGVCGEGHAFENIAEAEEITALLMRHWNTIAATLAQALTDDEICYWPLLYQDEDGKASGNDWAIGFMEGVDEHPGSWDALFDDDDEAQALVPMLTLAHEHDPDPEMRPAPIDDEQRAELLEWMAAGLVDAYSYFAEDRMPPVVQVRREGAKVGRNELCPCGSGRKFKQCCGAGNTTLQ